MKYILQQYVYTKTTTKVMYCTFIRNFLCSPCNIIANEKEGTELRVIQIIHNNESTLLQILKI